MASRKIKNQPASLIGSPVAIYYDPECSEYQVRISGRPDDTYFTDDKADAFSTAQYMRNTAFLIPKKNPTKRKNQARTQARAEGYVRRPSQITKAKPSKRLVSRRIKNLRVPMGVFPNPSKPKYPGAMDIGYPTYAAFSKDAKACGYDPKELLASGEYFKESDGHVLAKSMRPSVATHKEITVEQSLDKKHWTIFARFPDTPDGSKHAVEYAKAFSAKEPYLHIRVMTK
jgi:hypothetical protein